MCLAAVQQAFKFEFRCVFELCLSDAVFHLEHNSFTRCPNANAVHTKLPFSKRYACVSVGKVLSKRCATEVKCRIAFTKKQKHYTTNTKSNSNSNWNSHTTEQNDHSSEQPVTKISLNEFRIYNIFGALKDESSIYARGGWWSNREIQQTHIYTEEILKMHETFRVEWKWSLGWMANYRVSGTD